MQKYLSPVRFIEKRSSLIFLELQEEDFLELINSSFDYKNVVTIDEFSYAKEDLLKLIELASDFSEFIRCNDLVWQSEDLLCFLEEKKFKSIPSLRRIDKVLSANDFPVSLTEYIIDLCI